MSSIPTTQLDKELAAQRLRAKALEHLQKEGQTVDKINEHGIIAARKDLGKGGDNTLDLILRQAALEAKKSGGSDAEKALKSKLLAQQEQLRSSESSPAAGSVWKEVPDAVTGRSYYWNTVTNETSWEKPAGMAVAVVEGSSNAGTSSSVAQSLPEGWIEKIHPATRQKYYVHQPSGKSSSQHPSLAASTTGQVSTQALQGAGASASGTTGTRSGHTASAATGKRTRPEDIDPLDFTGGQEKRGGGGARDGRMADSTASGPLWQQRPYPAPGAVLRGKPNGSGGGGSGSNIGPSMQKR